MVQAEVRWHYSGESPHLITVSRLTISFIRNKRYATRYLAMSYVHMACFSSPLFPGTRVHECWDMPIVQFVTRTDQISKFS